jgi:hypothetical protein
MHWLAAHEPPPELLLPPPPETHALFASQANGAGQLC